MQRMRDCPATNIFIVFFVVPLPEQPQAHQYKHANDHGERVVIDVAGLEAAHQRGGSGYYPRRPVDKESVNYLDVPELPQYPAKQARTARKQPGIELVYEVFALE